MRHNEDVNVEELIKVNIKLTRENNKLLKKINRARVVGLWSKIIFYALIIGIPYLVYKYYLKEPLDELMGTYTELKLEVSELQDLKNKLPF